jgi:ribosome-binding factor A
MLIKKTISDSISHIIELDDKLITIMDVVLTNDLLNCKIYYSVLGNDQTKQQIIKFFKYKTKYIRHVIAHSLNLRYTPQIVFIFDNTNEKANNIYNIFSKIESEKYEKTKN